MHSDLEKKIIYHTPPEINYAFQNTVSFSQYQLYSGCPHRWYLQYGKKLSQYTSTIHTIFGSAIHVVLQHYLKVMYAESGIHADELDLIQMFNEQFRLLYRTEFNKSKVHFSSADEMREFFEDAVAILEFFKKNRRKYFSTRKMKLLGVEMPLLYPVTKNIYIKGYIDFILYDEESGKILIYDIKSSSYGWGAAAKKDETKSAQLILYREFFARQYQVEPENIEIEFFILKRKLYENTAYDIPRIQTFKPVSGKNKTKKAMEGFGEFIEECYSNEGKINDKIYQKKVSKNCLYCPFNETEHCNKKN